MGQKAALTVLVRIFPEDKQALERVKAHPRETVADVVHRARVALSLVQAHPELTSPEVPA